jgi:mannosyltransferase
VIAPSLSRRFSGVTASIIAVVPALTRLIPIRVLAREMPKQVPTLGWRDIFRHCRDGRWRVWHARRNIEMLAGLVLRTVLRFRFVLVFTSAAQRRHTRYTRWLYSKMDRVVATTSAAASYLDRRATVVRHGVDARVFHPPEDRAAEWRARDGHGDFGIAVFGRVRPNKGTGDLVDALCAVLPAHSRWGAVIVGEATPKHAAFRDALVSKVRAAGLADRVRFVGKVEDFAEIPGWYRAATLVVAPPRVEGFGLTVLEAMASGCAVVATRTGAFPEVVVEGETGWLVPCGDASALAAALGEALSDPDRLADLGRHGRARVEADFTIEREAAALAAIYEEELRGREGAT